MWRKELSEYYRCGEKIQVLIRCGRREQGGRITGGRESDRCSSTVRGREGEIITVWRKSFRCSSRVGGREREIITGVRERVRCSSDVGGKEGVIITGWRESFNYSSGVRERKRKNCRCGENFQVLVRCGRK